MYDLDRLAHDIADHGIHRHEEEVRSFASYAHRQGIAPTLAAIVANPANPPVARERAFARLVAAERSAPRHTAVA